MRTSPEPSRRTHVRYLVLAMIFLVTVFNYVDRATLSIAAPAMRHDLGFDAVAMGLAFSAFGWAYTAMQIPGGIVLDRFGSQLVLGASLILWSVLTFLQGYVEFFSSALLALFVLRFLMGVAESPAFPANNRLTVMWFPRQERGLATAIFQSAQYFALAVFTPLMVVLLNQFGWEHVFFWTGGAGILIGLLWFATVQEPRHDKRVSQSELDHIEAGGGLPDLGDTKAPFSWRTFKAISGNRMMLGIYLGQFCLTTITWFFLTWFPTYLVEAKGLTMLKVGLIAAIPPVAGCLGGVIGGLWSDGMLRRGYSLTAARKTPIIVGLLLSSSIVVANYTQSIALVTLVMSVAFFAKGVGNLGWCIVGDVSPKRAMGVSGAIFNFCGNIASIVTPLAIGLMINQLGSFDVALTYVAAMGLLGAFSYLVIVGPLKRLDLGELNDEPSATADADAALPATRP